MKRFLLAAVSLLGIAAPARAQPAWVTDPFVRYPDVCGDRIVFSFAGDLWLKQGSDPQARRLTSTPGPEYFAKFSPDCASLAFTARIDGDDQIFVMPVAGGTPRRLASYPGRRGLSSRWGSDNQVTGWTPDGRAVLFRSFRDATMVSQGNLYTADVTTGVVRPAGMARAGMGVFSPDGKQLVYSPWSRDFRTWKHYRGGWAQDLWVFDRDSGKTRQLTRTRATERDPIWTPRGIYFLSDRNGAMNLFRQDSAGGEAEQLTHHDDDAMWASADRAGQIVYEVAGRLWRYDPVSGVSARVEVSVPSDAVQERAHVATYADFIDSYEPAPDGKRALVVARGDVFLVGGNDDPVRAVTASSDAQEREATLSADGSRIAFISDKGGEEELWIAPAAGGEARKATSGNRNRFSHPLWSPDGKRIVMSGRDGAIYLVDAATGRMAEVARSGSVFINDYVWSPNGRYLAFTHFEATDIGEIRILDTMTGASVTASDPRYSAGHPAFSADGNYLFFLTQREFSPQLTSIEWDFQVPVQRAVAGIALRRGLPNPFLPDAKGPVPAPLQTIDTEGLASRLFRVPVATGEIGDLAVTAKHLIYSVVTDGTDGRAYQLHAYSFEQKEDRTLDGRFDALSFAPGVGTVLARRRRDFTLVDAATGKATPLAVARMSGIIDPAREWPVVLDEVCRRYRDFFYVRNMQGFDWPAICARYRAEVSRIGSRGDLTELIGRMVSELNIGHAYIDGKDELQASVPPPAALGATFAFDPGRGRWRIEHILAGDPIDPGFRSPLATLGLDVREGDWLLAIDGRTLDRDIDPSLALAGKAETPVALTLARDGEATPRQIVVKTVAGQERLVYRQWVERNRAQVEKLSGGRIGYVHVPEMSPDGLAEFMRGFFGQIRKDGLIVDIRGNLGGSGSPLILERLSRPLLTTGQIQGIDYPTAYPWGGFTRVFTGKLALLVNEATMSDGDTMAYQWRKANLGPIFGKRTWGGVVGTGWTGPLLDGTTTNVPQYALADTNGRWVVEGEGVNPDVELSFDETARLGGEDTQLAGAVRLLTEQIQGRPGTLAGPAPGPDRRVR